MSVEREFKKITTRSLQILKQNDTKISALTAYDYISAKLFDEAGIDIILVGDSVSNVFQGNETTLPVTLDEMIYHTKAVTKGVNRAMVVVDLPFMTYQTSVNEAFRNAGRIMKETSASAVKLEGGEIFAETVYKFNSLGIPVMGHIGLMPQSINIYGSYKQRGSSEDEAEQIYKDAVALQEAGAFAIVLEKIPASLAKRITEKLDIPTIGIGAGVHCDGQILVSPDMLGLNLEFHPRFLRTYADLSTEIKNAVTNYINDVKSKSFPSPEESY